MADVLYLTLIDQQDEAVRELFNWIKAVVWTIEQAAIVAGRRGWAQETR